MRKQKPMSPMPSGGDNTDGPKSPQVEKPNVDDLLKKMKKTDRDSAQRYKQRGGQ